LDVAFVCFIEASRQASALKFNYAKVTTVKVLLQEVFALTQWIGWCYTSYSLLSRYLCVPASIGSGVRSGVCEWTGCKMSLLALAPGHRFFAAVVCEAIVVLCFFYYA